MYKYMCMRMCARAHTQTHTLLFLFFIFIFGCIGSSLLCTGFLRVEGYSLLRCAGFSLRWLLLLQSMGSRAQAQ